MQTRDDLGRTRLAEETRRARRIGKNRALQSGGVLTKAQGRQMAGEKQLDEISQARAAMRRAEEMYRKAAKEVFKEAAKVARAWYITKRLPPAYVICTGKSGRWLRRI